MTSLLESLMPGHMGQLVFLHDNMYSFGSSHSSLYVLEDMRWFCLSFFLSIFNKFFCIRYWVFLATIQHHSIWSEISLFAHTYKSCLIILVLSYQKTEKWDYFVSLHRVRAAMPTPDTTRGNNQWLLLNSNCLDGLLNYARLSYAICTGWVCLQQSCNATTRVIVKCQKTFICFHCRRCNACVHNHSDFLLDKCSLPHKNKDHWIQLFMHNIASCTWYCSALSLFEHY